MCGVVWVLYPERLQSRFVLRWRAVEARVRISKTEIVAGTPALRQAADQAASAAIRLPRSGTMTITVKTPARSRKCASPADWPPKCWRCSRARQARRHHRGTGPHRHDTSSTCRRRSRPTSATRAFRRPICTSVNHVICHGIPSEGKVLKDGDIVNIDVTVIKDGWHGDTSRMYYRRQAVGAGQAPGRHHVRGDDARHPPVRPGATLGDIGHAIQKYAEANGFASCANTAATASARSTTKIRRCCTTASPAPA